MARILTVDDDDGVQALLQMTLTLDGHDVVQAANGAVAVEMARELQPDLILMDIMMPVLDGLDATRKLRQDPDCGDIPIVMLTACSEDLDVWEGWMAGAASYLTKPIDLDVLSFELGRLGVSRPDECR